MTSSSASIQHGVGKELVCYYCQQPGHKASVCPIRKTKTVGACCAPCLEGGNGEQRQQRYKTVIVNGQEITAMLDSGSFMSLVRQDLVPVNCINYSQQENVLCVHGDKRPYPTAELNVIIDDHPSLLTVRGVEKLPVALSLGLEFTCAS